MSTLITSTILGSISMSFEMTSTKDGVMEIPKISFNGFIPKLGKLLESKKIQGNIVNKYFFDGEFCVVEKITIQVDSHFPMIGDISMIKQKIYTVNRLRD